MKMKKVIAIVMAGILSVGALTGCGEKDKKVANSTSDIEIRYWNSGLGTDWLDAVIAGFEEKHPEYNVVYVPSSDSGAVISTFGLADVDTTDLYLNLRNDQIDQLVSLNDVLDSTPEGDSGTIREKFNSGYLGLEQYEDGNVYSLSWGGGLIGFVYNETLFKEAGITQLPRTTDELAVVCDTLYKKDIVPLCHFKDGGYYNFLSEAFFAQYNGVDYYYNNFYGCNDGTKDALSLELFTTKDGRYETLRAYEKFITPNYVLTGSNSNTHTYMQTQFVSGKCAMMVSGSWMSNEMASVGSTENFSMMKLPVISSIIDNLTTISKESELRKVISAIDNVTDDVKAIDEYKQGDSYVVDGITVSAADWDRIDEARNLMPANYSNHSVFIPSYSNAVEGTKEFLKYFYSDEGQQIFADTLHFSLPLSKEKLTDKVDEWNEFEMSQHQLQKTTSNFISSYNVNKNKIFTVGGSTFGQKNYIASLSSLNEADRKNADELWKVYVDFCESNYEASWLANLK